MFLDKIIQNRNLQILIDDIYITLQKNHIDVKMIIVRPTDRLWITNDKDEKIYYVYEQHGFTHPSNIRNLAYGLASRLGLYVETMSGTDGISCGDDWLTWYRLVLEDPSIKGREEKMRRKKLRRC